MKAQSIQRKPEKKAKKSCSHVSRTYTPTILRQIASIINSASTCMTSLPDKAFLTSLCADLVMVVSNSIIIHLVC